MQAATVALAVNILKPCYHEQILGSYLLPTMDPGAAETDIGCAGFELHGMLVCPTDT